ncbi:hypothetical protein ACQUJS_12340, partial [Ralstonia pseudosolanacearum]
ERHHLEFVLGGRRALEHPAIKYKGLAEGEAFVSNLSPPTGGLFLWEWVEAQRPNSLASRATASSR